MGKDKRHAELEKFVAAYRDLGAPPGSPAEQTIWLVLARHGSAAGAERAFRSLWKHFVDVNEFRVAKATEIASIIGRHVRGDAFRIAEEARGFLRRFHKDQHTIDFSAIDGMSYEQLRKYLSGVTDSLQTLGLALFVHDCQRGLKAEAEESAAADAAEAKPKRRGDKDLAHVVDRLRVLSAIAARGEIVAKAREAVAGKALPSAWKPGSAPEPPPPEAPAGPAAAESGTSPAPQDPAGGSAGPASVARGKGATRPRTTRAAKTRQDKRSSRR